MNIGASIDSSLIKNHKWKSFDSNYHSFGIKDPIPGYRDCSYLEKATAYNELSLDKLMDTSISCALGNYALHGPIWPVEKLNKIGSSENIQVIAETVR